MPADPIIYCLAELTDYRGFERFCCDLMVKCGWRGLEPLGGSSDGGRDALIEIFEGRGVARTAIFAISAREDWEKKIGEDLARIKQVGHTCDCVVFVSNRVMTTTERDGAVKKALSDFGLKLEVYSAERVRLEIVDRARSLIRVHPNIFTPSFFSDPSWFESFERSEPIGNRELAALELGYSSQNLVHRIELVAHLAGPAQESDLHGPLEARVAVLRAAACVLLSSSVAEQLGEALERLQHAVVESPQQLSGAAIRCQALLASSKIYLADERSRAAFLLGEILGQWDSRSLETRDVSLSALTPSLRALGLRDLEWRVGEMVERFRRDVHVPGEVADLLRHRLGTPHASPPHSESEFGGWSRVQSELQEVRGRFRKDGRRHWQELQATKEPAPDSLILVAERLIATAEDDESYAMVDLLRREPKQNVVMVWRRLVGPLVRGELGPETRLAVGYECVGDKETAGALFREMLRRPPRGGMEDDLLSAVFSCVQRGGSVLRANIAVVDQLCAAHEGHHYVGKIRQELG